MGLVDELKKITHPNEEDDDFFDGADIPRAAAPVSRAQAQFESVFGAAAAPSAPEPAPRRSEENTQRWSAENASVDNAGSIFGNLGSKKPRAPRERTVNFGGSEAQVILFAPKTFDDAKELVGYLQTRRSVVMTLESLPTDQARRMLDLCSGVALALQGKITPVSAKTFFVTPINVDIVGSQGSQLESDGQYF